MKTLRIINQNIEGSELTQDICLEGNNYDVVMKADTSKLCTGFTKDDNLFALNMRAYFEPRPDTVDESIVGFVIGRNNRHAIRNYNVAYIVNDEGKTVKRIYGQYTKY